jgi:ketosteroid isomerase-like protein
MSGNSGDPGNAAGGASPPMTIRVTHICRRIDGNWRLIHRHADCPPADQRVGKAA